MTGVFDPDWVDTRTDMQPAQRPATYGEVWSANRVLARGDRTDADAERLRREYGPIMDAVNADRARRGLKPMINPGYWQNGMERRPSADNGPFDLASLLDARITRDEQQGAIFGEIAAIRRRDPAFLKGIPDDVGAFRKGIIDREKAARSEARDVVGRSSGIGQTLTGFAGGVWETMHDPVNIASMPLGGGGTTLLAKVGRSALLNGGLELIQQPIVAENRAELGEELTLGEAGLNTLMGAAGGVIGDVAIPALGKLAVKGVGQAFDAAVPADRRIAMALGHADLADATDADIAAAFAARVPRELRTPDESAAIHVIEREGEIRASSPFVPTVESLNAHAANMQTSMMALVRAGTADAVPILSAPIQGPRPRLRSAGGRLASDVVEFFKSKGYSDAHARGIAAGVAAESASNHGATGPRVDARGRPMQNPGHGLGQWVSADRRANFKKRFGIDITQSTRQQQLEFLHWELQGGDAGGAKVLRQVDEASVLRSYIEDFMRPAKGAETIGDLKRGMAALGRDVAELDLGRALDVEGVDAPIARPAELDAVADPVARPEAQQLEIDYADVPQLRRDLFADDAAHASAQDALIEDIFGPSSADVTDGEPMVRLYRAQGDLQASRQGLDTTGDALWFTTDPEIAANYASKRSGEVFALDLPKSRADALLNDGYTANVPLAEAEGMRQFTDLASVRRTAMADGVVPTPPEVSAHVREKLGDLPPLRADRADVGAAPAAPPAPSPAMRDAIAAEPALADVPPAPPRQLELFDDPMGQGAVMQADSLAHDLRAAIDAEQLGDASFRLEDGSDVRLADVLADLDEDAAMIATMESCL